MFNLLTRPFVGGVSAGQSFALTAVRYSSKGRAAANKTHRAAHKRWRKTADGYKHGMQGRKHGNANFGSRVLKSRTGIDYSNAKQTSMLKRLLPFL